jgi:carbon monoxide dehydrogenase subunit G
MIGPMRFENSFTVAAPIDEVWETLLDLDKVAPAMPGAQVIDHTGEDAYKVAIKVKVGPMTMNYRGDVEIRDKDQADHHATMRVKAREARGQGTANADVTMQLREEDAGTHAQIDAEVQLAGKAAAMGRGLIEDVSRRLVDQFAGNLEEMLSQGNGAGPEAAPATEGAATEQREAPPSEPPSPTVEPDDSLDALDLVGGMVGDRMRDPRVLVGTLLTVLLLGFLLGRRGG